MGTNCAPLLADLFLYSYETEFLQQLVKNKKIKEARSFNLTFRYIDDVLSINNKTFATWIPSIYPSELEIKETTESACSTSFLDLHLEFDSGGHLSTKIYDKRDDFNFKIINFPNLKSNIPTSPAYGFIFLNSYGIAELVLIFLIFWFDINISVTGFWIKALRKFVLVEILKSSSCVINRWLKGSNYYLKT